MSSNDSAVRSSDTIQGFTKEGLAAYNAQFHKFVDEGEIANIVTLIARHGEIVNFDAYGVLEISAATPVPVKTDSLFRIASMAKPIIAAAMMMLWEEGKWALEDPVSKFIPEFEGLKVKQDDGELVPQASPMTMMQLMSHSAGFGARSEYPDLRTGNLQDMVDFLAKQPLSFQPGKGWRYGPSVDIQTYIIEKLAGQFLDEFLEQRIFAPLGMVDTGYVLPASKVGRLVSIHQKGDDGKLVALGLSGTYNTARPKFIGGGKGMLSTIKDYWRFSQMILNGGKLEGKHYLKESTVKMMHTNVLEPGVGLSWFGRETKGLGFGLGYAIVHDSPVARPSMQAQSYFWGGMYGTWFWNDPVNDMIVIGFINNNISGTPPAGSAVFHRTSAKAIYGALKDTSGD